MQNTTATRISRRQGIRQLGVSFGFIFVLFISMKVARGLWYIPFSWGNPQPLALNGSLREISKKDSTYLIG